MDKLQWGNRKRLRCVKVKDSSVAKGKSEAVTNGSNGGVAGKKKITSRVDRRVVHEDDAHHSSPHRLTRDMGMNRSNGNENKKISSILSSPEKEDRYYTTRGSMVGVMDESSSKMFMVEPKKENNKKVVWPKLYTTLSNKEKEEDFLAMKGCKLPQRPKKRAKLVQRTLLLVSPGAWLSDLCQERYEVREKKTTKKRPRGLKAMGSMESESE